MRGQGVIGRDCAWCGNPAVGEVEVQPAEYRTVSRTDPVTGERIRERRLARAAITAAVCDAHRHITVGQPVPVVVPRHRSARGVQQLGLFVPPDEARLRNAIHGDTRR